MTYCSKCGTLNEDDAEFCKKCGTSLRGVTGKKNEDWDDRCERECEGGDGKSSIFWAIIIVIFGLWILFEFVIKRIANLEGLPLWIQEFQFWWLIAFVISIALIFTGVKMIIRR